MSGQNVEASVKKDGELNADIHDVPRYAAQSSGRERAELYANKLYEYICLGSKRQVGERRKPVPFAVIEKFASYGVESSTEDRNSRHSSQRFVRSLGKVWLTMQWSNCRALY
jgi:hypothetical protein